MSLVACEGIFQLSEIYGVRSSVIPELGVESWQTLSIYSLSLPYIAPSLSPNSFLVKQGEARDITRHDDEYQGK